MTENSATDGEMGSIAHRSHISTGVALVAASGLTAFSDEGLPWKVWAVAAWVFTLLFFGLHGLHDWKSCKVCDGPPKWAATEEARARLARKAHARWRKYGTRLILALVLAYVVLPKPFLEHVTGWWRLVPAAVYALVAGAWLRDMGLVQKHLQSRGECHVERCRAETRRVANAWQRWLAHYGIWVLLALIPAIVALGVFSLDHGDGAQALYGVALLVMVYILAMMITFHTDTLCLICAVNPPHNGGELAEKRSRWLRLHHRFKVAVVLTGLGMWVGSWIGAGTVYGRALLGAAGLLLIGLAILSRVHGRVQPWCPWCRDDGGDEAEADVPDPSTNQPVPA